MNLGDIIGDAPAFFAGQRQRLTEIGIDISSFPLSHLAYRTPTHDEYLVKRDEIEKFAQANSENVWNGRPISKIVLKEPLKLSDDKSVPIIELIPPVHQRVYKMGMEHFGFVVGEDVDEFSRKHRSVLTGQQFQSEICEPYYVTFFEDFTNMKFYRYSLLEVCTREGLRFDGFHHVEKWPLT